MRLKRPNWFLASLILAGVLAAQAAEAKRPNILLIVADDLGYSDIGAFGGEIATPVLDKLAAAGMKFSNFHVLPTCSPTRAALMSGNDNHVAGMGVMAEFIYPAIEGLPGYVGHLSDQVATMPEILRSNGYHTYMAGKWHLGDADDQSPFRRGFEQTFTMMHGGGSHWSDMKPLSPIEDMIYRRNGERISELPDDFYSTKDYTEALIEFIDGNKDDGKPFFAYLSYTAPHDPLHAPREFIAKYAGIYDEGWDQLAQKRLRRMKDLGLVSEELYQLPDNFLAKPWNQTPSDKRILYARDMEVYAAMVDYMDMSIGRLLDYLDQAGLAEDTLVIFFSDNGANGALPTSYPGNSDGVYLGGFDNSLENRGLANSFIDLGPGWAQAVTVPFRYYKSFTTEGGIRSPMIVRFPSQTTITGQWNHSFTHVTDILPTLLDVAGASYPEEIGGKTVKQPIGTSILPILAGEVTSVHSDGGMGYELFEMKAFIQGDWKILRLPEPFGTGDWALFNLKDDPGEIQDVSTEHPEILADLKDQWQAYATENDVFDHKGKFDAIYRQVYRAD